MLAKGKGFRRLTAVEVSDSGTDDEFQPLNNTKRYQDLSGEGVFVVVDFIPDDMPYRASKVHACHNVV